MAEIKLSEMSVDASIAGTERLLAQGADGSIVLVSAISDYVIDELVGADEATPTTGDAVLMERSGAEGTLDLDDLADYAIARGWSAASEADPVVSGDMLLVDRSGTVYEIDVDTLTTYVNTGQQATILNISGLDSATVSAADTFLVCEGSTGKKATLTEIETQLWTDLVTHVTGLTAASTPADANELYLLQSGVAKKLTLTALSDYVVAEVLAGDDLTDDILEALPAHTTALDAVTSVTETDVFYTLQSGTAKKLSMSNLSSYIVEEAQQAAWSEVTSSKYTLTPPTTSTITMTDTSDFAIGYPVKWTQAGDTYYGVVTAISANAQITIAGPALSDASELSALYAGRPERVIYKDFFVDTAFGAAVQDIFSAVTYLRYRWNLGPAYLVSFSGVLGVIDTGGSQPKINVKVGGDLVSTDDSNKGLTLASSAGTWTDNTVGTIDNTKYDVARHDSIDIRCTEAGTNGDADCLTATLTFVLE